MTSIHNGSSNDLFFKYKTDELLIVKILGGCNLIKNKLNYSTQKYKDFDVHNIKDNFSFFHIEIRNKEIFLEGLCDFVLSEDNLLRYATNKTAIMFEPTKRNYISLFRELYNFIDDENIDLVQYDTELEEIIIDEYDGGVSKKEGMNFVRLSKVGRIGEYIFHIFLSDYFNFNCIIPKVKLTTDRNMSVHGIDALFLDLSREMILFGESKVTKKISNGVTMINKSLKNYEKEIREEYSLILSNNHLKLNGLEDMFPGQTELCISFDEFITQTKTKNIGVPIFIAHGEEIDYEDIFKKLSGGIKRNEYFGLNTIYYCISLPIHNKKDFFGCITNTIRRKLGEYNASTL